MATFSKIKPTLILYLELTPKELTLLDKNMQLKEGLNSHNFLQTGKNWYCSRTKMQPTNANYTDALVALWDGKSKESKIMMNLAKQNNLKVIIIDF